MAASNSMAEFHNLAEMAINREGEAWGNLGFWDGAEHYSAACRALAVQLGDAAGLDDKAVLFDAGFGCGDQLLLWLERYSVAGLCGVNLSHSQTRLAQNRLKQAGHDGQRVAVHQGDACDPAHWQQVVGERALSHVLALDCAYHFSDRKHFLAIGARHLRMDGVIALTDFVRLHPARSGFRHGILRWMLGQSQIPPGNMVDRQAYVAELEDAGFHRITMNDISNEVMLGFAWGQRKFDWRSGLKSGWRVRLKYAVTGRFLRWAHARQLLGYFVITATKN